MSICINEIKYKNFGNCLEIKNDFMTFVVTVDVGPRIISYHLNEKENIFFEDEERKFVEKVEGYGEWYAYGGHRLWCSPELFPETYLPDNSKVDWHFEGNILTLLPPATVLGKQYKIICKFSDVNSSVILEHEIKNISEDEMEFATWALTAFSTGGVEIVPQNSEDCGKLSNRSLVLWSYTDLYDSRLHMYNSGMVLKQDVRNEASFKLGMNNKDGYAAYLNKNQLFIKQFDKFDDEKTYPDRGCNFETYTNHLFLECETLGPIEKVKSGEKLVLTEKWQIVDFDQDYSFNSEATIYDFIEKNIKNKL